MPVYEVVKRYKEARSGVVRMPGSTLVVSRGRGDDLVSRGLVRETRQSPQPEVAVRQPRENAARRTPPAAATAPPPAEVRHVGGGWYELPDGTRIRGRAAAEERMRGGT